MVLLVASVMIAVKERPDERGRSSAGLWEPSWGRGGEERGLGWPGLELALRLLRGGVCSDVHIRMNLRLE